MIQRFRWTGLDGSRKSLEVDVVSEGGAVWHKAVARNAEALDNISRGKSDCGQKPLVHHADCFAECARQNQHHFQTPQVHRSDINTAKLDTLSPAGHLLLCKWSKQVAG